MFHLRTSQSTVVSGTNRFWLGSTCRVNKEERSGGHTVKSQNTSSKLLSSCAVISCSFFFFLLSVANQLPGKTQDSPINNERGKKNSSSWLEFNKSTSPSGLGLCTWFTGPGIGAIDRGNHSRLAYTERRGRVRPLKLLQAQHNKSVGDYCNCMRYFSDQLLGLSITRSLVPSPKQSSVLHYVKVTEF